MLKHKTTLFVFTLLMITSCSKIGESAPLKISIKNAFKTSEDQLIFNSIALGPDAEFNSKYNVLTKSSSIAEMYKGDGTRINLILNCKDYYLSGFYGYDKTQEFAFFKGYPKKTDIDQLFAISVSELVKGNCKVINAISLGYGRVITIADSFAIVSFNSAQLYRFENNQFVASASIHACQFYHPEDCTTTRDGSLHTTWMSFNDYLVGFESDSYYTWQEGHHFEYWRIKEGKITEHNVFSDYRDYEVTRDVDNIPSSNKMLWMNKFVRMSMKACLDANEKSNVPDCIESMRKIDIPEHLNDPYKLKQVTKSRYVKYLSPDRKAHVLDLLTGEEIFNNELITQLEENERQYWSSYISENEFINLYQGTKVTVDVSNFDNPIKLEETKMIYVLLQDRIYFEKYLEDPALGSIFQLKKF